MKKGNKIKVSFSDEIFTISNIINNGKHIILEDSKGNAAGWITPDKVEAVVKTYEAEEFQNMYLVDFRYAILSPRHAQRFIKKFSGYCEVGFAPEYDPAWLMLQEWELDGKIAQTTIINDPWVEETFMWMACQDAFDRMERYAI